MFTSNSQRPPFWPSHEIVGRCLRLEVGVMAYPFITKELSRQSFWFEMQNFVSGEVDTNFIKIPTGTKCKEIRISK